VDPRNLNAHYIFDKLVLNVSTRRNPEAPWLTSQMVEILGSWLQPTDRGLEWGAGRSTIWFAKRLAHLTSVESDAGWHAQVKEMIERNHIANVTLHNQSSEPGYVEVVDEIPSNSLNFVLVDGAFARDQCAWRAIPLLKSGGILVIDNIERYLPSTSHSPSARRAGESRWDSASWDAFAAEVANWRHIWTSNGVSDTALWVKP